MTTTLPSSSSILTRRHTGSATYSALVMRNRTRGPVSVPPSGTGTAGVGGATTCDISSPSQCRPAAGLVLLDTARLGAGPGRRQQLAGAAPALRVERRP